jgi:hypothetical protein
MTAQVKPIASLQVTDLQAHPVWEYSNREIGDGDETFVRPVRRLPVAKLAGKVVGTQVMLANGQRVWALIGNLDPTSARLTEHFLTLSVECDGRWIALARYHDVDYATNGPEALARNLGLASEEVFPIVYDIRQYAKGDPVALCGQILKEPRARLSRSELIAMAVP